MLSHVEPARLTFVNCSFAQVCQRNWKLIGCLLGWAAAIYCIPAGCQLMEIACSIQFIEL